ncbi:hypothetical protein BCV70DRAFT_71012 [Testicularia cyperi]|uniref:Protein kinase domain-containing protein n=1 Tax=Testicularia cyperi TaxID=1882483 RepID=A0A317XH73_9BASI|nr:hypothetical protein BCV70DRAFT_71012 [Testicularia cyperi]
MEPGSSRSSRHDDQGRIQRQSLVASTSTRALPRTPVDLLPHSQSSASIASGHRHRPSNASTASSSSSASRSSVDFPQHHAAPYPQYTPQSQQSQLQRSQSTTAASTTLEQRRRSAPLSAPRDSSNGAVVHDYQSGQPSHLGSNQARPASQTPEVAVRHRAVSNTPEHRPDPRSRPSAGVSSASPTPNAAAAPTAAPSTGASVSTLGHYQLGDCLGRGAFGSVYRGLNWTTGETVAVKQIQLGNIPKSELGEIMSEIDLLKNLKHPNIVKYKGSEKTRDFLYIILEYCENGSLHHICKRFGKFPEGLVSVYISQVLQGLVYLHDQGVIHRDIKGANILTTKDGSVKLADFGVATKTGAMSDYAVVGSPYWMAPEVIDQSGATTASDIWSVGCVVVELLEGKPPYHFLAPMPALFRIVQDDCPPLPEGASPVVKDFLLHCFQKDANLRVSARKLLRHPWMVSANKQLEQLRAGGSTRGHGNAGTVKTTHEEAVKSVQEWNQALEKPPKPAATRLPEAETVRAPLQPSLRRITGNIADLGTAKPLPKKGRTASRPTLPLDFSPPLTSHGNSESTIRTPATALPRSGAIVMEAGTNARKEVAVITSSPNTPTGSSPGTNAGPGAIGGAQASTPTSRLPLTGAAPAPSLVDKRLKLADLQQAEEATDNWDDDFEEDITTTKIAALEKNNIVGEGKNSSETRAKPDAASPAAPRSSSLVVTVQGVSDRDQVSSSPPSPDYQVDFDQRTIRPPVNGPALRSVSSSPQVGVKTAPPAVSLASFEQDESDDYSDLVADEDEVRLNERIQNLQMRNSVGKRLFHPNDLRRLSSSSSAASSSSSAAGTSGAADNGPPRPGDRRRQASSEAIRTLTASTSSRSPSNPSSPQSTLRMEKDEKWKQMRRTLGRYSEDQNNEDYSDLFGKTGTDGKDESVFSSGNTLQLTARLSNRSWLRDEDEDEDDPFAEIDAGFSAEADLEANVARDQHARMCAFVTELVESLDPATAEDELLQVCEDIDQVLTDMPEMKAQLLSSHGALALIQMLEIAKGRELVTRLLGILNLIIFEDPEAQENLCLIGAIPVVMTFTTKKWPHDLRLEAAHFVFAMCSTSRLTLQFVLSCRGLRTLVNLIDEDYLEQKDLVWIGVGCVSSVLELQSPASRNDFCRMLAQEGLLEPLSSALQSVLDDAEDEYAVEARANILQIFLIYSQSDGFLKKQVATRSVLRRILQTANKLEPELLTLMLKIVKNLSMAPAILDEMQNANTIEILTNILVKHHAGPHGTEMSNQVLNTMYNLCRLSKSRQEEAAQAGIIPQLLRVARTNSPLKQFALPILCDFAHAGKATRKMFWQHRGLHFYLKLLEDPYWQVSALESILVWLQDETARVEEVLLQSSSIESLVCVFATSKANSFENLLEPLLKVCRLSSGVIASLSRNAIFVKKLMERLAHPKAVVRLNLLRLTKMICDLAIVERSTNVDHSKIYELVEKLSKQDGAVLVRELARDILAQRHAERETRTVRRTMSETHVGADARGSGTGSNGGSPVSTMLPPLTAAGGHMTGTRASTAYRRKISGGGADGADSAANIANNVIHERSATESFSPPSSISAARSTAMRNLVGKLGHPRRSVTPSRERAEPGMRSSSTSPRLPLDQLPVSTLLQRDRKNSQPAVSSTLSGASSPVAGEYPSGLGLNKKHHPPASLPSHRAASPLLAQIRQSRSVSHDISASKHDMRASRRDSPASPAQLMASLPSSAAQIFASPTSMSSDTSGNSSTPSKQDTKPSLSALGLQDTDRDKDKTMRPPSRRPIPSLPSSHRFPSSQN